MDEMNIGKTVQMLAQAEILNQPVTVITRWGTFTVTPKECHRLMEIVHRLQDLKVATSRDAERRQVRVNVHEIPALNMGDADFLLDIIHREVADQTS